MNKRIAPLSDILFGLGAAFEAGVEYAAYEVTKSPDLLQMAEDSGLIAGICIGKGLISYLPGITKKGRTTSSNVNKVGFAANAASGIGSEMFKPLFGRQSKSFVYNAFTTQCLISTTANAIELYNKNE
jgi:hypothetical protein